jgi:Leucine-rich repeat (LRR) protein
MKLFSKTAIAVLTGIACITSISAYGQTPLPSMADRNLQMCLSDLAARNGWQYAEQVTQLDCPERGVVNLLGIEGLPSLTQLNLADNAIVDVQPLTTLSGLTGLNLSGNSGIDFPVVRLILNMNPGINRLGLNGIRVGSIRDLELGVLNDPITGKPRDFIELDLGNTGISEFATEGPGNEGIGFVRNFPNLERLNLANSAITEIAPLGSLRKLTSLNLSGNTRIRFPDLRIILNMNPGITRLGINGIRVGSIRDLELGVLNDPMTGQPRDYIELDLGNTSISEFATEGIGFVRSFPNLERLNLANSAITDVGPLDFLFKLTCLDLSGNTGIDIQQLRPVLEINRSLTRLGLNGIRVGSIGNLGSFDISMTGQPRDYVELDLGNTGISEFAANGIDFLQRFPNLERLNLAGNGISNLQGLAFPFSRLTDLDLANNAIVDVGPLAHFRSLTRLNLSGNTGIDIRQLSPLLDMNPGITRLGLNGIRMDSIANLGSLRNPMTDQPRNFIELDLGNTGIREFAAGGPDFIFHSTNLERLNLAGNGIANIQVFSQRRFWKLTDLNLANNAITDVNWLTSTRSLSHLNLSGNPGILCAELDKLAQWLIQTDIQRPVPCLAPNALPIAGAAADQSVNEGSVVSLTGSGKDPDGTIASYKWVQTAGPTVTLVNANSAVASFTAPQVAANTVLNFQLTVTDNTGATATAATKVTVQNLSGADLVVSDVVATTPRVRRGGAFLVLMTTANVGDLATKQSTSTCVYLSTDPKLMTGNVKLRSVPVRSLRGGASVRSIEYVSVPRTVAPGTYYVGAIADCTSRQTEIDEGNNSRTGAPIVVTK